MIIIYIGLVKIIKIYFLKRMKIKRDIKRENELKKEQLEFSNALSFYNKKWKKEYFIFYINLKLFLYKLDFLSIKNLNIIKRKNI